VEPVLESRRVAGSLPASLADVSELEMETMGSGGGGEEVGVALCAWFVAQFGAAALSHTRSRYQYVVPFERPVSLNDPDCVVFESAIETPLPGFSKFEDRTALTADWLTPRIMTY
jgi:hypothetical protein